MGKSFPQQGVGIGHFTWWMNFFTWWREPGEEWFWRFGPFSKLKTTFCENWTSIKIKINMTCLSKVYEIKTKMEQVQWLQLKMLFLLSYNLKLLLSRDWGGWLLVGFTGLGNFSRWGGEWASFWLVGGTPPPSAPVGKTLMFDYLTKTSVINLTEFIVNSINCIAWNLLFQIFPLEHKNNVYTISKSTNQWERLSWKMTYTVILYNNTK